MSLTRFTALLVAWAIAGCASYSGRGLRPGVARLDSVIALMGQPAMRWQDPDGSIQLAYPRGPEGIHTYMVRLGPDGRLISIDNVLDDVHLAKVRPGMTEAQVLRILGPPDYPRNKYFKARDELVWEWRACTYNVNIQRILVSFDGTTGTVRDIMTRDELFGAEGATIPCVR
jgi:SmpA / OmlA family